MSVDVWRMAQILNTMMGNLRLLLFFCTSNQVGIWALSFCLFWTSALCFAVIETVPWLNTRFACYRIQHTEQPWLTCAWSRVVVSALVNDLCVALPFSVAMRHVLEWRGNDATGVLPSVTRVWGCSI
jgi:hypothetical protein